MSLESIVRPFQNDPVFSAAPAAKVAPLEAAAPASDDNLTSWQGGADASWVEVPDEFITGISCEDPSRRVTETVKVTNPDDDSQYVMLERIKSTSFVHTGTGKRISVNFADWDAGRGGNYNKPPGT